MDLPKKQLKSAKGQILILFLLVLVVGVAIVLSVASRTITDTRTTTTTDESNRAYFAAEAGIEEALQELQSTGSIGSGLNLSFPTVNTSATTVEVSPSTLSTQFVYPENVARDDVAQVVLLNVFDTLSSGSPLTGLTPGATSTLNFWWGSNSYDAIHPDNNPAIEVTVVYCTGTACNNTTPTFGLVKFAFDPYTGRGNNFCGGVDTSVNKDITDSVANNTKNFRFEKSIDIFRGDGPGACSVGIGVGNTPVLARVRLLYNSSPEPVAVTVDPPASLPAQGDILDSTGTTSSGVARKLQVTRLYPALPALFDYVLFSGGDLAK